MRRNVFRFLVLTLAFCACAIFVSGKDKEAKSMSQGQIKRTACQQRANQITQTTQISAANYSFNKFNLAQTNNAFPVGFAFAMPQTILAFQIEPMMMDGTGTGKKDGRKIDWVCVAVCLALIPNPLTCADLCVMN